MIETLLIVTTQFIAGLLWGSFLNVIGYRIITGESIIHPRSRCPHCKKQLLWYDLIPLFSWLWLGGNCRTCHAPISVLYPAIEVATGIAFVLLGQYIVPSYQIAYLFFSSCLLVIMRSDLEFMLISRYSTLFAIPFAFLFSSLGMLPLSWSDISIGALFGFFSLYIIATLFSKITGKRGLGQGDLDMLAFIGAYTGVVGCWAALLMGSIIGSICGTAYILFFKKSKNIKLPFGPFLAIGAFIFILFQAEITTLLLGPGFEQPIDFV